MHRIAFATYLGQPDLTPDDRLAVAPLAELGLEVTAAPWDDASVAWDGFDAVVVRSTWNYHTRAAAFAAWLDRLASTRAAVWNPVPLLRWNSDKRYLRELAAAGVPIVPTRWANGDDTGTLADLMHDAGWREAVVKPSISAGAHETWRVARPSAADEARFAEARVRGGVMVQQYLRPIEADGEWSLLFLGGRFSHAVRKYPRRGDFRVQEHHGGINEPAVAPPALITQAEQVLRSAPGRTLYARVDGCVVDGRLVLMELEVLEPSLFLSLDAASPRRFAAALADALNGQHLGR